MAKLVSKTYGDALFELALEENRLDAIAEDITALAAAFEENGELNTFMSHPKISKEEKQQVMDAILDKSMDKEVAGFIHIVVEKGRFLELQDIFQYFINRVKEYKNIGTVYVTTAVELRQEQKDKIVEKLIATTKYETVEVHYAVDSALIGGMKVRIKDRVVDSSIQTKLYELTRNLEEIQLAV